MISIRITSRQGFSGGSVVKNLPVTLPGDMDLIPDPGWHASEQLSPYPQLLNLYSRAKEPQLLSPCATTAEALMPRAHVPQQENPP